MAISAISYYALHFSITAGRYCEHIETDESGAVATNCSSSLEDYLNTLTVSCEGDESEAAILTWTPDDNTPDLVYYQVITHYHMIISDLCCV